MKLSKSGHYRPRRFPLLADAKGDIKWNQGKWCLFIRVKGLQGPSTYDYNLEFSDKEFVSLIETALTGASKNPAIHASLKKGIVKGIVSSIKTILAKKNQDPRYRL